MYMCVCVCVIVALADESKLEEMVGELSQGLAVIKHEQEYMEVRERIHRMSKSIITILRTIKISVGHSHGEC